MKSSLSNANVGTLGQKMIDYEMGNLSLFETVDLFASLIESDTVWSLQGSYGRQAATFMNYGLIDQNGEINPERVDQFQDYLEGNYNDLFEGDYLN